MTPSPPHPEYIITEETASFIEQHFNAGSKIGVLRSRPHTTIPSEQQEWQNASLRDSEKFICQSERDKVLDDAIMLIEMDNEHRSFISDVGVMCYESGDVVTYLDSLRTTTPSAGDQP